MNKSLAALILCSPMLAFGQTYEKNGLPCIAELCIGDGMAELSKIAWGRATTILSTPEKPHYVGMRPLSAFEVKQVRDAYRGDVMPAAPYLSAQTFDRKALALLAGVKATCTGGQLQGTFTSSGGNPTRVRIALRTDKEDVGVQRWTVVSIQREYPQALSDAQQTDLSRELKQRYGRFDMSKGLQKGVDAYFQVGVANGFSRQMYGFTLSLHPDRHMSERYKLHPLCGGAKKIEVD